MDHLTYGVCYIVNSQIITNFGKRADTYDNYSLLQTDVAQRLFALADSEMPFSVLDIGCGTGRLSLMSSRKWPDAKTTALDASERMLSIVQNRNPIIRTIKCDAKEICLKERFDLIFSSMMLHWIERPVEAAIAWRKLLNPGGRLLIAVPVFGSLLEWRELCLLAKVSDRVWVFPQENFLDDFCQERYIRDHKMVSDDLFSFLKWLKLTGAHASNPASHPISPAVMRRLCEQNNVEFVTTFRISYIIITP